MKEYRVVTNSTTMLLPLSLLLLQFSLLTAALPPLPDPAPVLPLPSSTTTTPPSTIPAFPEQSDVSSPSASSSSCPLSLSPDLISSLSTSCRTLSPARCCPSLAASLYSAFAPTALSLPAAARTSSLPLPDLPALPDDSESCAGQVEKALRAKGVRLPRVNGTCDVAYCYCGVRLRRLTCAGGGGFVEDGKAGRWAATPAVGRRLRRECRQPGIAGCSRCLGALNQLNTNNNNNVSRSNNSRDSRECELMGLTWLLSKNRTLYLPAATSVLRAFMAAGEAGAATCSIQHDEMPFAVGSDEIGSNGSSATAAVTLSSTVLLIIMLTAIYALVFVGL